MIKKILDKIVSISIYLLVFLMPLFFLPFSFETIEFNKQYLLFLLVSVSFLAWLSKMIFVNKEIRFRRAKLDFPVLFFLAVSFLSALFSVDSASSLFGIYGRFSNGLISVFFLSIFYFLITNNILPDESKGKGAGRNKENPACCSLITVHSLLKTFIWSVFFVILLSYFSIFNLWQKLAAFNLNFPIEMLQKTFNPASGSLEGLTIFLSVAAVLLVGSMLSFGPKKEEVDSAKYSAIKNKFFSSVAPYSTHAVLAGIFGILIVVDFKPAWFILSASFLFFTIFATLKRVFKENINKLLLPICLLIVSIVFFIFGPINIFRSSANFSLQQELVLSQKASWEVTSGTLGENFKNVFIGTGIGTFHYDFSKYKPADMWQIRLDRSGSHIAEIISTMGFLGLFSYLALIVIFFSFYSPLFKTAASKSKSQNINVKQLPLLITFLALFIAQFVYYQNTVLSFMFWFFLAVAAVNFKKTADEKAVSFKNFPELSLLASVLLIILFLSFLSMYFFFARFYMADIKFRKAVENNNMQEMGEAVSLNPYSPDYKILLSRAYLNSALSKMKEANQGQNNEEIIFDFNRALLYAKGGDISGIENDNQKKNHIKGAVELAPNRVLSWETLGAAYGGIISITNDAYAPGIEAFEKAIALEPSNPILYVEAGNLYLTADIQKAREKFSKAAALKPDYIEALIQKALTYEKENNIDEAVKNMEEAAASHPSSAEIAFQLGRLYFNNGKTDKAIIQFKNVASIVPNNADILYYLGLSYEKDGDKDNAIMFFEKVLVLNPENKDAALRLDKLKK